MSKQETKGKEGVPQDDTSKNSLCPDEMTLASCLDGKAGGDDLAKVHLHLENCEKCRNLMNVLLENYARLGETSRNELDAVDRLSGKAKKLTSR